MGSLRMSVLLAATAFVYGCSSDPALSLHMEDNGKSFSVAEDQDVDMTTFMVGAGQYGDPGISSAAVRFDGMEFPKAQVPGGPASGPQRLWPMLAHRHAQLWNGAELGEAYPTVKRQLARRQAR